ncbi:hypothetical protein [Paenibacillus sabinae]|uniref:Uncharacterized protein n=1 Tax=Paenibacillus sabinae T27 TaxID=1268072 RepID=X4ZXY4_9BACL|nr:hypothetical protein [Paenibacillus sabinae]AHV97063.1 hypothetical protein PSAB_10665 [Paenibacillus sabinae T27]
MKRLVILVIVMGLFICGTVSAAEIEAYVTAKGEYGEVSTITGNGTAGQGTYSVDHPRFPVSDTRGNVYFLDGDQKKTKLRMWNGKRNTTIVDMAVNKVTRREGEFYTAGLAVVKNNVYFALKDRTYKVTNGIVSEMPKVAKWMKENQYHYIYRMESYQSQLAFMFWSKLGGGTYGFALYNPQNGSMEELLPTGWYGNPTNFELLPDGVMVATEGGFIYYEQFFPRKSIIVLNTNEGQILDVWVDKEKTIYYSLVKDKLKPIIRTIPRGTSNRHNDTEVFVGSTQGYTDGIADEVQMHHPTDFSWDGSGYIFSDRENNAIRKVWGDKGPLSLD